MKKGQHLAIESVATFGLTLIAAVGVVQMFGQVNKSIVDSTEQSQAETVINQIRTSLLQMQSSSNKEIGYHQVDLPDQIGGTDYRVALEQDRIIVFTDQTQYTQKVQIATKQDVEKSGSSNGGNIRIYKNQNNYELRSGR